MKRITIVIDPDIRIEEITELKELKERIGRRAKLHFIKALNPVEALKEVYEAVIFPKESYSDSVVLYSTGPKTELLNSLPCERLDLSLFMDKLEETVGSAENKYNKKLICTLYAAGISAIVK